MINLWQISDTIQRGKHARFKLALCTTKAQVPSKKI